MLGIYDISVINNSHYTLYKASCRIMQTDQTSWHTPNLRRTHRVHLREEMQRRGL